MEEKLLALWHWLVIGRRPSLRNGMVLASTSTDFSTRILGKLRGPRLRLSCVLDPRTCTVQISRQWLSVPAPSLVPHPQLCGCSCRSSAPGSAVSTA